MSKRIKVVLNKGEIRRLLQSPEVAQFVSEVGEGVKRRAGDGFSSNTMTGRFRAICRVQAETKEAESRIYRKNVLIKALHK